MLPNSKLLHLAAQVYIRKYNNYENTDMRSNGEHHWLQQALQPLSHPIVFDVGANVGDWAEQVLKINPEAVIHAFEPSQPTYKELLARQLQNVICHNCAMGQERGQSKIFRYENASSHNSLYPRHDKTYDSIETVEIDTLDGYCVERQIDLIDYLKIDTEGHELSVLQGAKALLATGRIRIIQFEYGNNYIDARVFLKDIFELLQPLNYHIYKIMPKSLLHIPEYHHAHEVFIYANYAAIHRNFLNDLP